MDYIKRILEPIVQSTLARGKSILLLGPRQTGKTTLLSQLQLTFTNISLIQPIVRQRYEQNPSLLTGEIEALAETSKKQPLIVLDEIQKVPELLDVVQDLIDRKIAQFILTGSSARKLRIGSKINLLPGRVVVLRLDPLMLSELQHFKLKIEELILYGSLPGIFLTKKPEDKEMDLSSYVTTYLEEEIRAEALVRNVGIFSRFLSLAASESGNNLSFRKLSQEIGVAHTTIAAYYQILEDCLIVERVDPLIETKTRRKLIHSSKYLFFDLGIRRITAGEGIKLPETYLGRLFEQWVGVELIRHSRTMGGTIKIQFWRDSEGPEVDFVIVQEEHYTPVEVKWTAQPTLKDIKHLVLFKKEYNKTDIAYLVCRTPKKVKLNDSIYAIPWQELLTVFS